MARAGRKPIGPQLVEHLDGSPRAKARLKAILQTLAGQRTIPEVCQELGIRESLFHRVRGETLQTALARLEPRPMGRPRLATSAADARIADLEAEVRDLKVELQAAEIRRELAEKLPRLAKPQASAPAPGPGKKTTRRSHKHRKL